MASSLPTPVRNHLSALRMLLALTAVAGILYPLLVTGIGGAAFPHQADGSEIQHQGRRVGSSLLGQRFDIQKNGNDTGRPDPEWFQPRPSAGGYDPLASGASNLGPNDPGLIKAIKDRRAAVAAFDGVRPSQVPADAVTASGSGLDPDISEAYAAEQAARVARVRHLDPAWSHRTPTAAPWASSASPTSTWSSSTSPCPGWVDAGGQVRARHRPGFRPAWRSPR